MKYFLNLIKILTISNFLFINNLEAKNEQTEGVFVRIPSEQYSYFLQKEQEAHAYQALNKEFVAEKKRVNDLMADIIRTLKEKKVSSPKKRSDETDNSQIRFVQDIENREPLDMSNDTKNNEVLLSQSPFEQRDLSSKITQIAQIISDKDRTISDLTKVISDKDRQINHLESQIKETTRKSMESSEKESRMLSISTSQIEIPQVHKALVVSDPTDISVSKSAVTLSESSQMPIAIPSMPRIQPSLIIENQGSHSLDPRKPRNLEEVLFSHTILFPHPKFEIQKMRMSLEPLLTEYTASKLFTEQFPEERLFVDERTKISVDPYIPQFESASLKMEKDPEIREFEAVKDEITGVDSQKLEFSEERRSEGVEAKVLTFESSKTSLEKEHTLVEPKVHKFADVKGKPSGVDLEKQEFSEERLSTGVDLVTPLFESVKTTLEKVHTLVEPVIHTFVSIFTDTIGIDPEPREFEEEHIKIDQPATSRKEEYTLTKHAVEQTAIPFKRKLEIEEIPIFSISSESQGFIFNNYGNHVRDGDNSTNHSRKTTIFVDKNDNNDDIMMTGHSTSPSVDIWRNNGQQHYDLTLLDKNNVRKRAQSLGNIGIGKKRNSFSQMNFAELTGQKSKEDHILLNPIDRFTSTGTNDYFNAALDEERKKLDEKYALLFKEVENTNRATQLQLNQQLTLVQQLSYQRSQDEQEKNRLTQRLDFLTKITQDQEDDLYHLIPPLKVINEFDDLQTCSHCKERSQILKRNEDLEQYNEKLAESVYKLQEKLEEKEKTLNTLLSTLHFQDEELLGFDKENARLTQENLLHVQKINKYEEEILPFLQRQFQIAQTKNEENEDEITNLNLDLALAKYKIERYQEAENEIRDHFARIPVRRHSLPLKLDKILDGIMVN